jgi:hypothetical protein
MPIGPHDANRLWRSTFFRRIFKRSQYLLNIPSISHPAPSTLYWGRFYVRCSLAMMSVCTTAIILCKLMPVFGWVAIAVHAYTCCKMSLAFF